MIKVLKGSDCNQVLIKLKNSNTNEYIPITDLNGFEVYVYNLVDNIDNNLKIDKKNKKNLLIVFKYDVSYINEVTLYDSNTLAFKVTKEMTKTLPVGNLYFEISYNISNYDSPTTYSKISKTGFELCELCDAVNPNSLM